MSQFQTQLRRGFKKAKDFVLLFLILVFSPQLFAATVTVSTNTTWTSGASAGADVVVSGATLTLGAGSYSWNSLTVQSSGIVVIQSSAGAGVVLTIAADASVDSTSVIKADGTGYASGGTGAGANGVSGNAGGGGGSHGGTGGVGATTVSSGSAYGSATQPMTVGSNGGTSYAGYAGGAGGGAIKLVVTGTLTVSGTISANGNAGANNSVTSSGAGGGGSGGSVWIQAGTLTGAGNIQAKGGSGGTGNSGWNGGIGGGGRIAINYTTNTFSGTVSAAAGSSGYGTGTPGSYFLQDSSGNVSCNTAITNSFDPSSVPATAINNLTISNGCVFTLVNGNNLSIAGDLTVGTSSSLVALTGTSLSATNATTQPTTTSGVGAVKVSVAGTTTITGTVSGTAVWLKTDSLTGAGTISQSANGAIAIYYSTANTFNGTITINSGSFFLQNYSTGDLSCPYNITSFFNPANTVPAYSAALHDLSITNGCKYGFPTQATGTSASVTLNNLTIDSTPSYFYADGKGYTTGGPGAGAAGVSGNSGGGGGGYGGVGGKGVSTVSGGAANGSSSQPVSLGSNGGTGYNGYAGGAGGGAIKLIVSGTMTVNGIITANGIAGTGSSGGTNGAGGGGSGGSIWIQVGTLTGTGTIRANGGAGGTNSGGWNGGGGGGGRIAVYSTTNNYTGSISVIGGTGTQNGNPGTYFTQDPSGNITCNTATTTYYDPSSPPANPINNVTISNGCVFTVINGNAMSIGGDLLVDSSSSLVADTGTGLSATNPTTQPTTTSGVGALQLVVAGTTTITGTLSGKAVWLKTSTLAGAGTISQTSNGAIAIYYSTANTFSGTITINNGSFFLQNYSTGDIKCPYNITSYFNPADALPSYSAAFHDLSITNGCKYGFASQATGTNAAINLASLTIDSTPSYFYADGKGYATGGPGAGSTGVSGNSGGGGGGYGGVGGKGVNTVSGGAANGSISQPTSLGSNGGAGYNGYAGGVGGGAIKIVVSGTMTIDGIITANGTAGTNSSTSSNGAGGGGSGGSIWLQAGTFAGAGTIRANGGGGGTNSSGWNGGSGSGGRIAVYFTTKTFSGTVTASGGGGTGAQQGAAGTIAGLYPATKLVFTTQPSSTGMVGVSLGQQPILQAQDGTYSTLDVNYATDFALSVYTDATCTTPFTGATATGSPQTPSAGIGTFSGVKITKYNNGNPVYLKATSGSLASACSTAITLSPGSASVLVFTTQPSVNNTAGVAFSTLPVVKAQDDYSNTDTSYVTAITLSVYSDATCATSVSGGVLSGASATPTSGVATFAGTNYTKAGTNYYFKAASGSLTSGCSSAFNIAAGAASQLAYTVQPSATGSAGVALALQPEVTIQDAYGNTVSDTGTVITLQASAVSDCSTTTAAGTLTGSATTTLGVAPYTGVAYTKVGTIYLKSSVSGMTACSGAVVISPGAATKLGFSTQPSSSGLPSVNLAQQPVVVIQDAYDNTVTSSSAAVTLAPFSEATCVTPSTGTLSQSGITSSGVASFSGVNYDKGEKFYIGASSSGLTSACSNAINLSAVRMFFRGW